MSVELGNVTLEHLTRVDVREATRVVRHAVPGLSGDLGQVLGRPSVTVRLQGIFYGANAADELHSLRAAHLKGEPVDFFTEAVGEGYFAQVLITGLQVAQRAGYPDQFDFACEVMEYVEPPQPAVSDPFGALDAMTRDIMHDELETIWQPIENLQILFNYSYLHATIENGCCFVDTVQPGLGNQDLKGQTVPQSPRNKISLNGNYTFHLDAGDLNLSASWIWKDRTYDSIFNRPWYLAPAYSQVDMRASFTAKDNRYTVIAFVKNLTNVNGYDNVGASLLGAPAAGLPAYNQSIGLIPPRTYGLELQYRFR